MLGCAINKRIRNAILYSRSYLGADCGSSHKPVVAMVKIKLENIKIWKGEIIMHVKELRKEDTRKH